MSTTLQQDSAFTTLRMLKWLRSDLKENQTEFWSRFGVTPSQGSRYEQGMCMSSPLVILLSLYVDAKVNDVDLLVARSHAETFG